MPSFPRELMSATGEFRLTKKNANIWMICLYSRPLWIFFAYTKVKTKCKLGSKTSFGMTRPRCLVLRSAQTLSRLLRTRSTPVRACRTNTGLPWPRITCVPMSAHGQPLENHLNVFIPDRAHSGFPPCMYNEQRCLFLRIVHGFRLRFHM